MIVVDVGNTTLNFAYFKGKKIIKTFKTPSFKCTKKAIKGILLKYPSEAIIVCSVVPRITKMFEGLKGNIYIIGKDIEVPIKSLYSKKNIGMDRLVGSYAARVLFPKTRLILDFGTAITLDFLSKSGDYLGGIILPGIGSTLRVLSNCALLPKRMKIKRTKKLIPQNTNESITRGLDEGFSSMVNALVENYMKKLKISKSCLTVVTGGEASVLKKRLGFAYKYESQLVIKGLYILAAKYLPKA